jgi:hypothetical protein
MHAFYGTGVRRFALGAAVLLLSGAALQAQLCSGGIAVVPCDPGPRPGSPGTSGTPIGGLNPAILNFWDDGVPLFAKKVSVTGSEPGAPVAGLGPGFNGNSCAMCHAQPAEGGSSPGPTSPQVPQNNPQTIVFNEFGALNTLPSFITAAGPVREARFINVPGTTTPDGGVHDLFTIRGRGDAGMCGLLQPDFATELANHNVVFRIPTPTFGLGFIENTPDLTLQANLSANAALKTQLGISGHFNTSANDGTIARFGWKAQNKSLLIFAGEAFNVEQGVSNENFPNERSAIMNCVFNPTPEDFTPHPLIAGFTGGTISTNSSLITIFGAFMRLNAPPTPTTSTASEIRGRQLFLKLPTLDVSGNVQDAETSFANGGGIGCVLCHSGALTTAASPFTAQMSNVTYQPLSDIAVHKMGPQLADSITQGAAGPADFRTAPLWGVGQRIFFLHDGRDQDLIAATRDHATIGSTCSPTPVVTSSTSSEATQVINRFNCLTPPHQQDLINYLRSL